jgi:hypothetical protein
MASTKRGFLVARFVDGRCQLASKKGYFKPGIGAYHPLVEGMTEVDHDQICKAICWMADNPGVTLVDLTADASYRVSWL